MIDFHGRKSASGAGREDPGPERGGMEMGM
jgi:hypothetical protein